MLSFGAKANFLPRSIFILLKINASSPNVKKVQRRENMSIQERGNKDRKKVCVHTDKLFIEEYSRKT